MCASTVLINPKSVLKAKSLPTWIRFQWGIHHTAQTGIHVKHLSSHPSRVCLHVAYARAFIRTAKCVRACVYILCVSHYWSTCVEEWPLNDLALKVSVPLCTQLTSSPALSLRLGADSSLSRLIPSDLRKHTFSFLSYLSTHSFLMPERLFGHLDYFILSCFSWKPTFWYSSSCFSIVPEWVSCFIFIFKILKSLILTCVPKHEPPSHFPPHYIPLGHPRAPAPSMLYPASDIDWRFNSYMIVYMLEWSFLKYRPDTFSSRSQRLLIDSYCVKNECLIVQGPS